MAWVAFVDTSVCAIAIPGLVVIFKALKYSRLQWRVTNLQKIVAGHITMFLACLVAFINKLKLPGMHSTHLHVDYIIHYEISGIA